MYIICERCNAVLLRDKSEPRFDDGVYIKPCNCILEEINKDAIKLAKKILENNKIKFNKSKELDVKKSLEL